MLRIVEATTREQLAIARTLFEEYAEQLGHDLGFQHFDRELESLPGSYAPPTGCLLLGMYGDETAGCVALRRQSETICEIKRLFLRPDFRRRGFGRQLASEIIDEARRIGYERMRLDTLETMAIPRRLYRSLGFRKIPPYYDNPIPGAEYFELKLH